MPEPAETATQAQIKKTVPPASTTTSQKIKDPINVQEKENATGNTTRPERRREPQPVRQVQAPGLKERPQREAAQRANDKRKQNLDDLK